MSKCEEEVTVIFQQRNWENANSASCHVNAEGVAELLTLFIRPLASLTLHFEVS